MANSNQSKLVRKVFRFLIMKAHQRQTATYEEIAMKFSEHGLHTSGSALGASLSPILYEIFEWCQKRGQPPLTSIVVRKSGADEGLPGQGFWDALNMSMIVGFTASDKWIITQMFHKQVFDYYAM